MEAARSRLAQAMEEHARAQARNGHIAEWKNVFGPSFDVRAGEHVSTAVLRHQDAARTAWEWGAAQRCDFNKNLPRLS